MFFFISGVSATTCHVICYLLSNVTLSQSQRYSPNKCKTSQVPKGAPHDSEQSTCSWIPRILPSASWHTKSPLPHGLLPGCMVSLWTSSGCSFWIRMSLGTGENGVGKRLFSADSPIKYNMALPPQKEEDHPHALDGNTVWGTCLSLTFISSPPSSLPGMKGRGSNWAEVERRRLAGSQGPMGVSNWQLRTGLGEAESARPSTTSTQRLLAPSTCSLVPKNFTYETSFKDKIVQYFKTLVQNIKSHVSTSHTPMMLSITYDSTSTTSFWPCFANKKRDQFE